MRSTSKSGAMGSKEAHGREAGMVADYLCHEVLRLW